MMLNKIKSKITDQKRAHSTINDWKTSSKTIVFTNGCFDIIHKGHVEYLAKARELGDKLIVGLNSDKSVKRLKGEGRPLQDESSRLFVMASLECVDMVILFEDDTPKLLIDSIVPDVLVKGGDYSIENIVGADTVTQNGGKVITINFVDGYSTTNIVSKMK